MCIRDRPYSGYRTPTEASEWIIRCAEKEDPRPLYLLMWGLLEDLAQAPVSYTHLDVYKRQYLEVLREDADEDIKQKVREIAEQ